MPRHYVEAMNALPAFQQWTREGLAETLVIERFETVVNCGSGDGEPRRATGARAEATGIRAGNSGYADSPGKLAKNILSL